MILLIGFLIRLVIILATPGLGFDMVVFGDWGRALAHGTFGDFYARVDVGDHLPGDLYLHAAIARLFALLGGDNSYGAAYRRLVRIVPACADVGIGWSLAKGLSSSVADRRSVTVCALYVLNPATVFLSSWWGQWDAVTGLILLAGFVVVWRFPQRWLWSIPLCAWAVMIKPPLAPLVVLLIMWAILRLREPDETWRGFVRRQAIPWLAAIVVGLVTITLIGLPFDTGLPGMSARWDLVDRVRVAIDLYPYTTLSATNIWMIPLGSPEWKPDSQAVFLGLSASLVGRVIYVAALVAIGLRVLRLRRRADWTSIVVWAVCLVNFAYFLFPTRTHERYLYPTLLFLIILCWLQWTNRQVLGLTAVVSATYLLTLIGAYYDYRHLYPDWLFIGLSFANIALFVWLLFLPLERPDVISPGGRPASAQTGSESRPAV